jgi:hypothetical protein
MGVIDILNKIWKSDAKHYVYAEIPGTKERQDKPVPEIELEPESHYARLWLSEMFLADDRKLFRQFVPVVHSAVQLQFGQRAAQELPYIAGPQKLGLDEATLGAGVQLNHQLTNLLPYRGGTLAISAALVAYKKKDLFGEFVGVLNSVSGLLNVGQLSSTLKVVEGAVDGIQNLLGAGDKEPHLVYYQAFAGKTGLGGVTLKSGYTAIIRADAKKFKKDALFIKNAQLHYGTSLDTSEPLTGFDYMLLRLEATTVRDDVLAFEEFAKLLVQAISEGRKDRAKGDAMIQTIHVLAWASPDLTNDDRLRVAQAVTRQYERALGGSVGTARSLDAHVKMLDKELKAIDPTQLHKTVKTLSKRRKIPLDSFLSAATV